MSFNKTVLLSSIVMMGLGWFGLVQAQAPVVDIEQSQPMSDDSSNQVAFAEQAEAQTQTQFATRSSSTDTKPVITGTLEQRVAILERQINNITQMDLVGQINSLQQQVAQLQGQLNEQAHQLQVLNDQSKAQYQDLDQRITTPTSKADTNANVTSETGDATPLKPLTKTESTTSSAIVSEQQSYQAASNLLKNRDYVRATKALQDFLGKYPNSQYVANTHYWLGEIYLLQGQPDQAIVEFNKIINDYPISSKVPNAMLKLGFAYADKGDTQRAKQQLQKVKTQFPGSSTAQLAIARLHELQ